MVSDVSILSDTNGQLCTESRHRIRDELNAIRIGLSVFKDELEEGLNADAVLTYQMIIASLNRLATDRALAD